MKKTVFLISIGITLFFISCQKPGRVCQVSKPLTELPWLAAMQEKDNVSISKAVFRDKVKKKKIEGFIIETNKLRSYHMTGYLNCSGETLCGSGGFAGFQCNDYEILKEEVIYETD